MPNARETLAASCEGMCEREAEFESGKVEGFEGGVLAETLDEYTDGRVFIDVGAEVRQKTVGGGITDS